MVLSAEFFEQVLKSLKANVTAADKRAVARVGVRAQVRIIRFEGPVFDSPQLVWTRDVSRHGIGILSPTSMKVGQLFVLEMPKEDDEPTRIVCIAKCRKRIDKDLCVIGAVFQNSVENVPAPEADESTAKQSDKADDEGELIRRIRSTILD